MNTQLFIENYEVDVSADISSLLTFELDNVKNFAARGTTWSKTVVLPGTGRNNKTFGHIFQIGQSNNYDSDLPNIGANFNASKSADCILFQGQMQTFKGVLRLLQINVTKGRIEYEVGLFGEIALLNVELSSRKLEDLDFSAYNHVFNETNIVNSWDNAPGSGYFYPLIDYGTNSVAKHNWDIRTFRPALYVKEYIDKMFDAAGFRYSSALFETDRFKRLVIPNNDKQLSILSTELIEATGPDQEVNIDGRVEFDTSTGTGFTLGGGGAEFTYAGAVGATIDIDYHFETETFTPIPNVKFRILKNGVIAFEEIKTTALATFDGVFQTGVVPGDVIEFQFITLIVGDPFVSNPAVSINSTTAVVTPVAPGDSLELNGNLPKNIRQIDFFSSIIKMFNLYVYEDRFDNRLINITPYFFAFISDIGFIV